MLERLLEYLPSRKDYNLRFFKADLLAGLTVAVVALPLALAFGVASGAGAAAGLYPAILAGALAAGGRALGPRARFPREGRGCQGSHVLGVL